VKRILFALILTLICSGLLFGQGIKYNGDIKIEGADSQMSKEDEAQMKSMGMGPTNYCEYEAMAQGGKYKMVYLTDFAMFKKGSYMLGDANSKVAYFVFPDKKTYWEFNIDEMGQLAQNMQKMVKMTYSNESVTVTPLTPKVVGVLPCSGTRIKIIYDTQSSMMGMKTKGHTEQQTDYYTTTAYDVLALFGDHNWHSQGLGIGDPVFDRQIAAKVGFLGFPVQVITETWNDGKYSGKTTMTTRNVQLAAVSPTNFILPSGYTKETPGAFSMMKDMMKGQDGGQKEEAEASTEEDAGGDKKEEEKSDKIDPKKLLKKGLKKILK
jgi:hypothetical protein